MSDLNIKLKDGENNLYPQTKKSNITDLSIINNLTSTDTSNPLSAAQGKVLNDIFANTNGMALITKILSGAVEIQTAFDYNTISTGLYYLNGAGPLSCTNGPASGVTNCYFLYYLHSTNRGFQIVTTGNNSHAYYRGRLTDNVNWNPWYEI